MKRWPPWRPFGRSLGRPSRPGLWLSSGLLLLIHSTASAHIASTAFLRMQAAGNDVDGIMELAVRDGELAVGLDSNQDGNVTWGEVLAAHGRLAGYLEEHVRLKAAGVDCPLDFQSIQLNDRVDGPYLYLAFSAVCRTASAPMSIAYTVLQDIDPSHRGLLTLTANGATQTVVLGESGAARELPLRNLETRRSFVDYFNVGVQHILAGFDHLLFLLTLLLPAVLRREQGHWVGAADAKVAALGVLKVVTAFTAAHSITLSLAAFDVVRLPSRFTETAIAFSIIVAALNNLRPLMNAARWQIAFAFGLLHGFGFASVLSDMGLPSGARLLSLVAFNLGVEAGQLLVVAAVMPLVYGLRTRLSYARLLMPAGSIAIATVACYWFVQRAFP